MGQRLMAWSLLLPTTGCSLRVISEPQAYGNLLPSFWSVLSVSAVLELAAVLLFAFHIGRTLATPMPAWFLRDQVKDTMPLYWYATSYPAAGHCLRFRGRAGPERSSGVPPARALHQGVAILSSFTTLAQSVLLGKGSGKSGKWVWMGRLVVISIWWGRIAMECRQFSEIRHVHVRREEYGSQTLVGTRRVGACRGQLPSSFRRTGSDYSGAGMSSLVVEVQEARAQSVMLTDHALTVDLVDGRTIVVPLVWFPRLWHGTPQERRNFEIFGDGACLHGPELDGDPTVAGLLAGRRSGESAGRAEPPAKRMQPTRQKPARG